MSFKTSQSPREAIAAMESKTNRPLIENFLRQVNALPQGVVCPVDLTSMWEAAGRPPDGKPVLWREALFAAHGCHHGDYGFVMDDGRLIAPRMLAVDYLMRLDTELDYLGLAFAKIVHTPFDMFAFFAGDPTPAKAAIAIGMLLCSDPTTSLTDAVNTMRGFIKTYAEHGDGSSLALESKVARMQRALRGEDPEIAKGVCHE